MTPPPPPAGQAHEDLVARGRALLESLAEAVEGDLLGREGQDEETHDEDVAATFQAYGYQPLDVVDEDAEGGLEQWPDGSQWPPDTALPPEEIAPQEEEEQQQQQQQPEAWVLGSVWYRSVSLGAQDVRFFALLCVDDDILDIDTMSLVVTR
eukprot:TRINITY_DN24138_c1_g1_i1.p2 TRINITY_DN24138_c1_g1~~TRINITY_DN24138_c1_g1_i1.p2  ORF type:complete len:161 (-),score=40.22 TRINITY_DN24138_c1_g1_i1:239-694(-)